MNAQSRVRGDKCSEGRRHRFRMNLHMDGCHWFQSGYVCLRCGASLVTYDERDPAADPYSLIWMEPTSDEPCVRCDELIAGGAPRHFEEVRP